MATHNFSDYKFEQDSNGDYVVTHTPTDTVIERIDSGNTEKILEVTSQISTLTDANTGNTVYDSSSEELTADVNNESVNTEVLGTERHYAGAYDGADADARLDNAIAAASAGEAINLEGATYTADRTISTELTLIGTGGRTLSGTNIDASWTLSARILIKQVDSEPSASFTFDTILSGMINCGINVNADITVDADRFRYIGNHGGDVTFNSGTSAGIIDGNTLTSITDNGSNTVGDNA